MNVGRIVLSGETLFSRVPLGRLVDMPKAARRVYEALHYQRWLAKKKGTEIDVTIGQLCETCGVKRRCVTKGLEQLEKLGIILRDKCMAFGRRIIRFLVTFAGENRKGKARASKSNGADEKSNPDTAQTAPDPAGRDTAEALCSGMRLLGWRPELSEPGKVSWQKIDGNVQVAPSDSVRIQLRDHQDDIRALLEASRPARE
jgi:hypothetical protein